MIYIIKQREGLYQNKVNSSLVSTFNCKMDYCITCLGQRTKFIPSCFRVIVLAKSQVSKFTFSYCLCILAENTNKFHQANKIDCESLHQNYFYIPLGQTFTKLYTLCRTDKTKTISCPVAHSHIGSKPMYLCLPTLMPHA